MVKRYFIVLVSLFMLIMAMPLQVFADESVTAEIHFDVEFAPGTVVIEAADGAPLPAVTEFADVLSGKFEISYSEPGDYYYKIYQRPGSRQDVTYDNIVYNVTVSIFVNEDGELYAVVTVSVGGSDYKPERIVFTNVPNVSDPGTPNYPPYNPPPDNPPDGPPDEPDDEPFDEVQDIPEIDAPPEEPSEDDPDESEPYSEAKDPSIAEEEEKLSQTGQLWWPMPIMLVMGILMITSGVILIRKKH